MPRVTQQQTDKNRIAIEDASARLFREKGINGVSVSDLMAAAGLTHGGFYGHFASKDGLAAVACSKAFEQSAAKWAQRFAMLGERQACRRAYVENYLSVGNRDKPGISCAAAALAGDVAREPTDKPVRAAYLAGVKSMAARLASLAPAPATTNRAKATPAALATRVAPDALAPAKEGRAGAAPVDEPPADRMLVEMATMVGALILSRATRGDPISEDFLRSACAFLLNANVAAESTR